jgi:hypothetical protein
MNADIRIRGHDCCSWIFQKWILTRAFFILLTLTLTCPVEAAGLSDGPLLVAVTDSHTGTGLDGAAVYIDGGYAGITSGANGAGTLRIDDIQQGSHTVRVTDTGYQSLSETVTYPDDSVVQIALAGNHLVTLNPENNNSHAINIVFIPSSTYFRTSDNTKVSTDEYTGNETRFREDVTRIINDTFENLDAVSDPTIPLPQNYTGRFNFYYYFDPLTPADAFSGCAGHVPDQYWNAVTFSDLTVILYPRYEGWYTNASSQPVGCYRDFGTGHKQMKIPASQDTLAYHEMGHGLYGLVDTYCGDAYYFENDPYPNVWSTQDGCISGATADNRDPLDCRKIQSDPGDPASCIKNFWRWDPDPDIMKTGDYGTFGVASTERIAYILNISGAGDT